MINVSLKKRIFTSIILFLLLFLILSFETILAYTLIVLGVFSILEFVSLMKKIKISQFYIFVANLLFIIYVFSFCCIFLIFFYFIQLKIILFSLLICCVGSDIGGFIIGKIFQGPKLTKISPKKTLSGSLGSLIFSSLFLFCSILYFTNNINYKIFFVAIITSIACQVGDLFFSFLKRNAKVKDTGNFFPGHGGVLDRLDGIFLGIPIGFLALRMFY
ncbi:phosphatidate cytidylyltransferase [Pelagibacteraceae bacterium]|jgi:phosphatidate cytidylyltransferase|nr:phosphatidate cytidylyltransferase [Pelagibacteraceae bacterium]